jgi:hypothetical protein
MTRKRINCLTNLESISSPFQIAFSFNMMYGEYIFDLKPLWKILEIISRRKNG